MSSDPTEVAHNAWALARGFDLKAPLWEDLEPAMRKSIVDTVRNALDALTAERDQLREREKVDPVWRLTFSSLLADVEEAVSNCAELSEDDPTLPGERERYAVAQRTLYDHVDALLAILDTQPIDALLAILDTEPKP